MNHVLEIYSKKDLDWMKNMVQNIGLWNTVYSDWSIKLSLLVIHLKSSIHFNIRVL